MGTARLRDLVVLLPGLIGSVLQKDGVDIWGISPRFFADLVTSGGNNIQTLKLSEDDHNLDDLSDGISASRLIPGVTIIPGLIKLAGYSWISQMIRRRFQVEEGTIHDGKPANFIEFPYDWRRDNRVAARQLKKLIDARLPQWKKYSGATDAKVILLVHSMGGLIARYFLEVLEGWPECRMLISLGTPFRGSVNALDFIANGYKQMTFDMTMPLRSFTAVHQLLPIYPAIRVGASYYRPGEADDIPGISAVNARSALQFHHEIMESVNRHRKNAAYLENGYKVIPLVGTCQPTKQSATLVSGKLTAETNLPDGVDRLLGDGDGTVPRLSATPVELSDAHRESFFPERHAALPCNAAILDYVHGKIVQSQIVGLKEIRGSEINVRSSIRPALSVELDDLFGEGETVRIRARLINMPTPAERPRAFVQEVSGGPVFTAVLVSGPDGWSADLEGLRPGTYRVEVRAAVGFEAAVLSVQDFFEVASSNA